MSLNNNKLRVLFLCTGNSCRSQMAEGWARHLKGEVIEPFSAGTLPTSINSTAVRVMAEAGVDISQQHSKSIAELLNQEFDFVVTVCGHANDTCPNFSGNCKVIHHGFDDPPALAEELSDSEQVLNIYRRVRDEIKVFIKQCPELMLNYE